MCAARGKADWVLWDLFCVAMLCILRRVMFILRVSSALCTLHDVDEMVLIDPS